MKLLAMLANVMVYFKLITLLIIFRLQEKEHIILTPFERNLDFWRQLWRVIERRCNN